MSKELPTYDVLDAMDFCKKKYPFIPIKVIRRILFANDLYQHKVGIIGWKPKLGDWYYTPKRKRK